VGGVYLFQFQSFRPLKGCRTGWTLRDMEYGLELRWTTGRLHLRNQGWRSPRTYRDLRGVPTLRAKPSSTSVFTAW
jgi:hypothetical protein